ncbi:MAG TPA: BTAD domain-containing putative transcriptional regulator [Pseudonocardiaceae bacterium]|nr:BTAD domain-containing putative transcriptional regulator [Pseudonocardiaceae bacterium]
MQFRLLGNVEAYAGGRPVDLGHARQRCVLATLLVEANRTVSVDQLVDRVWGDSPPKRGRDVVYSYLSRLRSTLAGATDVSIVRRGSGYALLIDEATVDLHRFRQLVGRARTAEDALPLYEQALGLWHGEAFADLDTPWLAATRTALEAERFAAELDHADVALRGGRHAELVGELAVRAGRHPLDERIAGQYMLALYRNGRQADALRHYQRIRSRLADELGSDPSAGLEAVYRQVLTADAELPGPRSFTGSPTPRQLPAAPQSFTGRADELAVLSKALDAEASTVAVSAIGGIGGIGKTSLVLRWAHDHLHRFPDGQLFVNLRGFDPAGAPMSPTTALRGFLVGLGVSAQSVPDDVDAQAALYRSLVADKRMLIVLDNARDTAQITPLLPGSASCTLLITSRSQLAGLAVTGARLLALDVLSDGEARGLLAARLGDETVAAEPEAVADLLRSCAGLPLAISIVAARAAAHPGFPLSALAAELRDATTRLDALDAGELTANLRAVFGSSYETLDAEAATLLGLLGLAPGPDIGLPAVASLAAVPAARARVLLHRLETAHLVQQYDIGRYRMHDLVRLYAIERARHSDEALRRLVDFYLHTAHQGDHLLYPHRPPIDLERPVPGCVPAALADADEAMAWFDAEHACLLAAQRLAADREWHREVWQLAWSLSAYHRRRGRLHDDGVVWRAALAAAERLHDTTVLAQAHKRLGGMLARAGEHEGALEHLRQALAYTAELNDVAGQIDTHQALTVLWATMGDYQHALDSASAALDLARTSGNEVWQADALNAVGMCEAELDRFAPARAHCEEALRLQRSSGNGEGEAETLDSLGYLEHRSGNHAAALDYYRQALGVYDRLNFDYQKADTLERIGDAYASLGQPSQAADLWHQAIRMYETQNRTQAAEQLRDQVEGLTAGRGPYP